MLWTVHYHRNSAVIPFDARDPFLIYQRLVYENLSPLNPRQFGGGGAACSRVAMTRPRKDGQELMSYMNTHAAFAPAGGIQELSFDEIDLVGGGIAPLVLAGAVLAATVKFSFIRGVFAGIREKAQADD